jgi:hypothetical protein
MLTILGNLVENHSLIEKCEEIINSIIESPNAQIWFEDENGNRFVPTAPIKIGHLEWVKMTVKERD